MLIYVHMHGRGHVCGSWRTLSLGKLCTSFEVGSLIGLELVGDMPYQLCSEPLGPTHLCLPSAGIASSHHHTKLSSVRSGDGSRISMIVKLHPPYPLPPPSSEHIQNLYNMSLFGNISQSIKYRFIFILP